MKSEIYLFDFAGYVQKADQNINKTTINQKQLKHIKHYTIYLKGGWSSR